MTVDPYFITRAANEFPAGGAPVLSTLTQFGGPRPGLRARSAAHAAFKAAQQHLSNLEGVRRYAPQEIAPDALSEIRGALMRHLRDRTTSQFQDPVTGYIRVAERAADEANTAADRYRPKLDPESTTQLIRTDQAWNNHIKPMLDTGKEWAEIIPALDRDGILAAERFAPGHEARIRDRFHQHEVPAVLAGIRAASERRAVEIAPPEGQVALREALDTATSLEFTRNVAQWASTADALSATAISIGLTRGAYQASVQKPVDTSPEGLAAYQSELAGTAPKNPGVVEHGPGAATEAAA